MTKYEEEVTFTKTAVKFRCDLCQKEIDQSEVQMGSMYSMDHFDVHSECANKLIREQISTFSSPNPHPQSIEGNT